MHEELVIVSGQDRIEQVRQLFLEYAQSLPIDLSFQHFEEELQSLPGKYSLPDGRLFLALYGSESAGCVAFRRISEENCEMKRLYVRDAFKGIGLGKKLALKIIEEARLCGYKRMRLDTLSTMKAAVALYESLGFQDIEPYIYNPIPSARYMELKL